MKFRHLTAILSLFAIATTGLRADEVYFDTVSTEKASRSSGAYLGVFGGGALPSDADTKGDTRGVSVDGGQGWLLGAEVGYYWRTPLPIRPAIELEGLYLNGDFDGTGSAGRLSGSYSAFGLFTNALLSLDLTGYQDDIQPFLTALRPYIGAGIGGAYVSSDSINLENPSGKNSGVSSGSEISFAYQLFAGLEVALSEDFSVYGEYKRLVLDEIGSESVSNLKNDIWTFGVKVEY